LTEFELNLMRQTWRFVEWFCRNAEKSLTL